MKIGIMGMGVVGKAIAAYHKKRGEDRLWPYDTEPVRIPNLHGHEILPSSDELLARRALDALNQNAEIVFICTGTPYAGQGKGLDCSSVFEAVNALTGSKTVIIKSTVMPGTTDKIADAHPEHRVFFVPEFLSADTAVEDYAHPKRSHILGDPRYEEGFHIGLDLRSILPDLEAVKFNLMRVHQAELIKLATNAFYALKVSWANWLADLDMSQNAINDFADNPWIGENHWQVDHKGYRGFDGGCLPKDTSALIDYAEASGCQTLAQHLLTVCYYNCTLKAKTNA